MEFCRASLRSLPAEKYLEVEAKALCEAILCGEIFVDGERLLTLSVGWKFSGRRRNMLAEVAIA